MAGFYSCEGVESDQQTMHNDPQQTPFIPQADGAQSPQRIKQLTEQPKSQYGEWVYVSLKNKRAFYGLVGPEKKPTWLALRDRARHTK
jgi:hypothetical protein